MSAKAVWWTLLMFMALAAVLLFNYWASFQPLSTLAYTGIVLALCGLANLAFPFRFLAVRKRATGALILAGGGALVVVALLWPAQMIQVAQHRTCLDDIWPEYQFSERHAVRVHAKPEKVIQATRQSTWGDLRSLTLLLRIRGAILRLPSHDAGVFAPDNGVMNSFAASGFVFGGNDQEILIAGAVTVGKMQRPEVHTLQELAGYRGSGWLKTAFDFNVEDAGEGWSTLTTETRMAVDEEYRRGPAIYWRLMVPGSGLLRREWLDGIKKRAEGAPGQ